MLRGCAVAQPLYRWGPDSGCTSMEIFNTFVLKSYIHSAAIFGGICHPFRRALSSVVSLYSATGVDPKVFQVVLCSLLSAEPDLLVTRFILASAICQVFKGDLLGICSPRMRKYRIGRDSLVAKLSKAKIASIAASQKTHCFAWSWTVASGRSETRSG
jgi:hypothetical protein